MSKNLENLSPFELNLYLESEVRLEKTKNQSKEWLDAGRGNPNWTARYPREAYFLLGEFATEETHIEESEIVGSKINVKEGRTERFEAFTENRQSNGAKLLKKIWEKGEPFMGMSKEDWLTEMLDYMIGDNYPHPERVLRACEEPIKSYLTHELFQSKTKPFDIFAVEGGTAGIIYTFNSLLNNHLLEAHDKIALMIPTFAPYLEIPELPEYGFEVEYIQSELIEIDGNISYQFPEKELDKLKNTDIKAVFVVNPSNPTAHAIYEPSINQLKYIVKHDNPDLMILSDDVYGTFLHDFTSLFTALPYNTLCIYSYSKYFGSTGWRVGAIALAEENVFDKLLIELSEPVKEKVKDRYELVSPERDTLSFIDRMVADSRSVPLNHASGLSTPQQAMMTLFSLYALLDEEDLYKKEVMAICHKREALIYNALGLTTPVKRLGTAYYCEIDLAWWIEKRYNQPFKDYIKGTYSLTDLIARLAEEEQLLLLKADAFGSSDWSLRISLANLETEAYEEIGKRIVSMMNRMLEEWE